MDRMRTKILAAALLTVLVAAIPALAADTYNFDKAHTRIGFTAQHLVISSVDGRFKDFNGVIVVDPDITKSSVKITIKTASVDTDNESRDNDLRNSEFLDVAKFPEMTFVSDKIEKRGEGYVAIGTFTLKGVSKKIELPFTFAGPITDPWGLQRVAAKASTKINRQDYGVKYNQAMKDGSALVGNEVTLNLTVEATKAK
jgi:polyisoprenoid-binding protein YceI